jgi:dTMP kinase
MRGKFISLEGIDGSGKTTQLRLLESALTARGIACLSTFEPGGTTLGRQIRQALLRVSDQKVEPLAELLLFAAARAQHVSELISPALDGGRVVLCDRFIDATVAYQGYGRGIDLELISRLNELATRGLKPDLTIVLEIPVTTGLGRAADRGSNGTQGEWNRLDREPLEFHERVRKGYQAIAQGDPTRVRVVDASGDEEETSKLVIAAVQSLLS